MQHSADERPQSGFSLIADFEGDIRELFDHKIEGSIPILPLRNMMLFPGVVSPISVGRASSLKLIEHVKSNDGFMGIMAQRDANIETPGMSDLFPVGVIAKIVRTLTMPDGTMTVIVQAGGAFTIEKVTSRQPFMRAYVSQLDEIIPGDDDKEFFALADACRDLTVRYIKLNSQMHDEATFAIKNIAHPVFLINFICSNLPIPLSEKSMLIDDRDVKHRAYSLIAILNRECQFAQLKESIESQTREEIDKQQKEYFLQQQIKNIQNELGNGENDDVASLIEKANAKKMPAAVRQQFDHEVERLSHIHPQSPDYNVQMNYLDTIVSLPWGVETDDNLDIHRAKKILDQDHYGLERVKERILEHLADLHFRVETRSPILCLYGPPGVGKTSLGKSIAKSLGRSYVRISLGGVHDEAEIRGHRRTYVASMPGRIVKSLIKANTENPVFVLDEIDKICENNYNGDPQSALLEVLDPEQNNAFHDNYLDLDIDLSKVFFIATANSLNSIPRPLLDRMELIEVEGYLTEEKCEIARRHLIPDEQSTYGNEAIRKVKFPKKTIEFIIEKYTRESGVRQLEKQIQKLFRKLAYRCAMDESLTYEKLLPADIEEILGKPIFTREKYSGNRYAGVVVGLAWTSVGGEILFIETSLNKSRQPRLTLTGNLGDVMKESAMIALEYVKAHADNLGIDSRIFEGWNLHVHVPEGATPKDGPSAGITIATSIVSAITQRKVRPNIAMTGELTLRGKVLPVGGIKEKILAAKRAGITDIVMSEENRKDIEEIKASYLKGLTFHYVENVAEVFDFALLQEKVENAIEVVPQSDNEKCHEV